MKNILIVTWIMLGLLELSGQDIYQYQSEQGDIVVKGTSSLHDWEMDALVANGEIRIKSKEGILEDIASVELTLSSSSIVSGNSIMDKKTSKALNAEKYPDILFKSTGIKDLKIEKNRFAGIASGTLSISGAKVAVEFPFEGSISSTNISVTGTHTVKMSDFSINPPTAMMGTLKTGDEISIVFNTNWKKKGSNTASK